MPDTLDVLAWNPHRGNDWDTIADALKGQLWHRPDVIVLNEVRRHHDRIARWGERHGYDVFQEMPRDPNKVPVPEHGSTALLVTNRRPDLAILSHRVVKMRVPWRVFSHNMPHHPRRYERVRLEVDGCGVWKVTASHWPTNGFKGGNRLSFAESATRAAAAFVTRKRVACVDVGDHNENVRTLSKWAKTFGGKVAGHGPDSAIVTRATVTADKLSKWGSDHHAMRYTITRR